MRVRLTSKARALRRAETTSEELLWRELRDRRINGWKFRRQVPRGPCIVDFLCVDAGLVVEVDGAQHLETTRERDEQRTKYLESLGLRVLRVWNSEVLDNMEGVLEEIYLALGQRQTPSPGASRAGLSPRGEAKQKAARRMNPHSLSPRGEGQGEGG